MNNMFKSVILFLTPSILGATLAWPSLGADWPQYRLDASRSAASPESLPATLHLQWVREFPAPRPAWPGHKLLQFDASYEPVVLGKTMFVASMINDRVTALDTGTGARKWVFYADGPIRFAPVAWKTKVYVASDDGQLYCLDALKGNVLWKFRGGPSNRKLLGNERLISMWPARGGPVLADGTLYFAAGIWPFMGIFVHALNAETGERIWVNDASESLYVRQDHTSLSFAGPSPQGYLAVKGDRLIVPCGGSMEPAQLDRKTGRLISFGSFRRGSRIRKPQTSIQAGAQTYDASKASSLGVPGKVTRLLAADEKLFVLTQEGGMYCFGQKERVPTKHAAEIKAKGMRTVSDAWGKKCAEILRQVQTAEGYCLVWGMGTGRLAEELVSRSKFHVIVIDPNREKVESFRRRLDAAGLYGTRITVHQGDPVSFGLPPYLANLIVTEDSSAAGFDKGKGFKEWSRVLRPYGGLACLPVFKKKQDELIRWDRAGKELGLDVTRANGLIVFKRPGPLVGAPWTHEYGDAGNTLKSDDRLVKAPLGVLWFGGASDHAIQYFNRASSAPSPLVVGGRVFIQGIDQLYAIDVYTGRLLWNLKVSFGKTPYREALPYESPKSRFRKRLGYSCVALEDQVCLATGSKILCIDPRTGRQERICALPDPDDYVKEIRVLGKHLVATTPQMIVCFDRGDGSLIWQRKVEADLVKGKFVWNGMEYGNLGFAAGGGRVYCISDLLEEQLARPEPPAEKPESQPVLYALDLTTGHVIWRKRLVRSNSSCLSYSQKHDILVQGAGYHPSPRGRQPKPVVAYEGSSGKVKWTKSIADPGPFIVHGERIITQGHRAFNLLTGEPVMRRHPLTGTAVPWNFFKSNGCNYVVASEHLLTFKSGAAGYFDLANDGGTGNLGGFRSGCRNSLIVADGVLVSPRFANGCSCSFPLFTSMAFVSMPKAESWTSFGSLPLKYPIQRVGINFGAPGDRRAEDGTLWLDYPSVGGPSPEVDVTVEPKESVEWYRFHSSLIRTKGTEWVAASGAKGVSSLTLQLDSTKDSVRRYTVRLYFCEPDESKAGERVFTVTVQGRQALKDFDIVKEAGGLNRSIVREFKGVKVRDELEIKLTAKKGKTLLSGVEIIAEEEQSTRAESE